MWPANTVFTRIPAPAKTSLMRFPEISCPLPPKIPIPAARQPDSMVLLRNLLFSSAAAFVPSEILDQIAKPSSPFPRILEFLTVEFLVPWAKLIPSAKLLRIRAFSTTRPSVYFIFPVWS